MHPDALQYPMYDATVADSMKRETELFFDSIVRADRNVLDLLTADYTYVNQSLAAFYGIPNVAGPEFRKVSLAGTPRRGLLGQGSILVETSVADRTDPVLRGKWVLEVLLGQPPPPPPAQRAAARRNRGREQGRQAAVGAAADGGASGESVLRLVPFDDRPDRAGARELRSDRTLADSRDNGADVDASTTLYDGTKMKGLEGLDQALLKHQDTFLRVFTENLMAYALGRQVQYYDMPTVRAILHNAARTDDRFSSFILGIVNSDAFRMSRADAGTLTADDSEPNRHSKGQ